MCRNSVKDDKMLLELCILEITYYYIIVKKIVYCYITLHY